MAKFTGPKGKIVRRFGVNIFGNPKYDEVLRRREHGPGQHGAARSSRKVSDYALQLIEKQKLRYAYGLLEKQFRRLFQRSERMSGVTGDNLLILLETRLDTLVFRAGFGQTLMQSRQMVNHGHIKVNGLRVNIASYQVKAGDRITVREHASSQVMASRYLLESRRFDRPEWFAVDQAALAITVNRLPQRDDIECPVNEKLIVEYYSK